MAISIVDSHIHLFPASHLKTLAWYRPSCPLDSRHCVDEYKAACRSCSERRDRLVEPDSRNEGETAKIVRGFIFIETDRISGLKEDQWDNVLEEVSLISRIAAGTPLPGEGRAADDKHLCLGIVPWAPMPAGPLILKKYMDRVRECIMNQTARDETIWRKVCGVRYLVQDKPPGVMLQPDFIKGLRWLGEVGLTFDLGVDQRSGGIWQLQEATQMLQQVHEENGKVKVIINHLCKPNLQIISTKSCSGIYTDPDFLAWKQCITEMSHFSNVYMKLSGGFSEIPPLPASTQGVEEAELTERLAGLIRPWTDHIFDVFTASRVMFGSDWPVCNIGGGGNNVAWSRWAAVVEHTLEDRKLSASERRAVWGDNALRAYGIEPA